VGKPARSAWLWLIALLLAVAIAMPALALEFPKLTGRVVDEAGVVDAATRAQLTRRLEDLETRTTAQLVVVTLKSLQGTTIEDFGYQLGRAWQLGRKDKNNGVLLIVAPAERKVRIEVGYGLEGTLTDAATKIIIESTIIPRVRANDVAGGIVRGTDEIIRLIAGDAPAQPPSGAPAADQAPLAVDRPDAAAPAAPRAWSPQDLGLALLFLALALGFIVMYIVDARPIIRNTTGMSRVFNLIGLLFFEVLRFTGSGSSRSSSGGGGSGGFSGGGGSFGGGGSSGSW
jgi:uncharacterized protein